MDRSRRNACLRKKPFESFIEAKETCDIHGGYVYRCRFCHCFHISTGLSGSIHKATKSGGYPPTYEQPNRRDPSQFDELGRRRGKK
jgi:hypothetical protein